MVDPNPKVNNKGIELLSKNGIDVKVGILEEKARELNRVFIKNITYKKPYIITKIATTAKITNTIIINLSFKIIHNI